MLFKNLSKSFDKPNLMTMDMGNDFIQVFVNSANWTTIEAFVKVDILVLLYFDKYLAFFFASEIVILPRQ
jgi:hypothetical protein